MRFFGTNLLNLGSFPTLKKTLRAGKGQKMNCFSTTDDEVTPSINLDYVLAYFQLRSLKMPENEWQSLGFLNTELGEVYEALLAKTSGWVRNNPDDKISYSEQRFAEELGDVIMMAIITGHVAGVDPIDALVKKMLRNIADIEI